jgi:hypothetical protein
MNTNEGIDLSIAFPFRVGNISISAWLVAEVFLIVSLLVYCLYASIVVWQVYTMSRTVVTEVSPYLKLFAWLHFVASLSIFGFVIFYWI